MQSTRWKDNNPMMTSKALLRKRAGSLSEEKIAQIRQEMFEYDLSSNSSPRTYHLKTLLSPESLPSTEATIQTYNEQYYHSQNRLRVSSKLSNQTSGEKGYPELSPVPYNASYNHGAEPHGLTPSRRPHGNKGNQLASALDLEALMPAEAKRLCSDLEQLSSEERKIAMIVDEATFSAKIQQEIDCVGCVSSLHTYLYELSELAKNKPGSVLYFEGFVVYGDRRIGFSEEKIGDIHNIAYILHHHKSKNSIIDELTRSLNIKKKHDGHTRGKVLSRCLLHSKKPMPNGIWREALQNLIEHDINEVASVAELDEPSFVTSLQMHTKRRKFCSTCRDNIMFVYDNMLEEASNCSDCEEGVEDEDDEEEEEEEVSEENGEEAPIEAPELDHKTSTTVPEAMTVQQNRPSATGTSDYETVSEPNENGNSRGSEQSRVISYTRKTPGSLLACIKYCPERRKLAIPLEMEIFMEFLSKADTGTTMHTKHANTKEAAQEELVACIGTCLKERLQNIWRTKKSEELARILFMKLVADCVVDGITQKLEEKNYKLGHKTILEEYLNETEAAQQQKKEKLRQKRLKRKEKKKKMQTDGIDPEDAGDEQEPENENIESKEELKEAEIEINTVKGSVSEIKENKEVEEVNNNKGKKEKKKKKGKNTAQSPPHDKTSTDSQTPETKKSVDKGSGAGKKNRKEVEEEEKLERKKRSDDVGSVRNNRFAACDERERRLLMSMGWTEETSEVEGIVDEKEVKKLKEKWKEIEASRADFRKNAKEKFMRLLYSK